MKIFGAGTLDEIRSCTELGVDGILTNPQGFDQYFAGKRTLKEITADILAVSKTPVFIQIHAATSDGLVQRARELHELSSRVGFKILANTAGFPAIRRLQQEGIDCIATCLFSVSQASVAATVGAYGICPFVSRSREIGIDPAAVIGSIRRGYDRLSDPPVIVAVSLKGLGDVELAIDAGADVVGMRYPLLQSMMGHIMTDRAEALFAKNWARVKAEDIGYLDRFLSDDGVAE